MNMITLPPVIDRTTAGALVAQLDTALEPGASLVLEGRDVARIGQSGLQLLLSAKLTAESRGVDMTVHASGAMAAAAELSGLSHCLAWVEHNDDQ